LAFFATVIILVSSIHHQDTLSILNKNRHYYNKQ